MYVDGRPVWDGGVQDRPVQDRPVQDLSVLDRRVPDGGVAAGMLVAASGIRDGAVVTSAEPGLRTASRAARSTCASRAARAPARWSGSASGSPCCRWGPTAASGWTSRARAGCPRSPSSSRWTAGCGCGACRTRVPLAGRSTWTGWRSPLGEDEAPWAAGTQLRIGPSVLTVQPATRADADLRPASEPGHLDYNRPPRLLPPMPATHFRLPAEPIAPSAEPAAVARRWPCPRCWAS